jgi:hypothetical protein
MTVTRAKVLDEGDTIIFHTNAALEAIPFDYRPSSGVCVPKMWANFTGLHVQSEEDARMWTVYPFHAVEWYEEAR